jgi:hypothetical protein
MHRIKTFLTVIGAVTILVLAANTVAYAATGGKFVLGQTNKANKATTLKRTTSGPALNLVTKPSSTAPFTVNSNGKVANLNADSLDGLDSSSFAPASLSSQVSGIAASAPIAEGFINTNGTIQTSRGVSASVWDAGSSRYEITLTGVNYFYSSYATTVTPTCSNTPVRTDSASGHLLVQAFPSGTAGQCSFAFTVIKLP